VDATGGGDQHLAGEIAALGDAVGAGGQGLNPFDILRGTDELLVEGRPGRDDDVGLADQVVACGAQAVGQQNLESLELGCEGLRILLAIVLGNQD
jgi:hypothetical protein